MLQIKNLISDENVIQVIFTAETKADARTMIELFECYASDCFRSMMDFSDVKIPMNKEVFWTLNQREKSSCLNYE